MRAKKLLALALAGMALTTCLSGCDRTIIEHQFHTNTEFITETKPAEGQIEWLFTEVSEWCESHNIQLQITINYSLQDLSDGMEGYKPLIKNTIGTDDIAELFRHSGNGIIQLNECEAEISEYITCWKKQIDNFYAALENYQCEPFESLCYMRIQLRPVAVGESEEEYKIYGMFHVNIFNINI